MYILFIFPVLVSYTKKNLATLAPTARHQSHPSNQPALMMTVPWPNLNLMKFSAGEK
jgi:hypothetical protein